MITRDRLLVRCRLFFLATAAALIFPALHASPAAAVQITGNTYAAENGGPATNPTALSYNKADLVSVSANIRSDVSYSHAQSWASASVSAAGVTKTTGGRGWADNPPTLYNNRSNLWNASATGTEIVANYTPAGLSSGLTTATFQFSLPKSIALSSDPFYNTPAVQSNPSFSGYVDPSAMLLPVSGQGATQVVDEGVIANGVGHGAGTLPTFFDVIVNVDAFVTNGPTLFSGGYEFDPDTGVLMTSGDFDKVASTHQFVVTPNPNDPMKPDYSLGFANDIIGGSYDATVGVPFDVKINLDVTMGNQSKQDLTGTSFVGPTFDFTDAPAFSGVAGASGEVTGAFLLLDQNNFAAAPVPEPSTWSLAAGAAIGLLAGLRRRK